MFSSKMKPRMGFCISLVLCIAFQTVTGYPQQRQLKGPKPPCKAKGRFVARTGECDKYVKCDGPGAERIGYMCPPGSLFDPFRHKCIAAAKAIKCNVCFGNNGQRIKRKGTQGTFYECVDNTPQQFKCKSTSMFDTSVMKCIKLKTPVKTGTTGSAPGTGEFASAFDDAPLDEGNTDGSPNLISNLGAGLTSAFESAFGDAPTPKPKKTTKKPTTTKKPKPTEEETSGTPIEEIIIVEPSTTEATTEIPATFPPTTEAREIKETIIEEVVTHSPETFVEATSENFLLVEEAVTKPVPKKKVTTAKPIVKVPPVKVKAALANLDDTDQVEVLEEEILGDDSGDATSSAFNW